LQREALQPDEVRREIQSRLRSKEPPDVFAYDTGPGFGGVLADAGLLRALENAYKKHGWDIYEWAKQQATYDGTVYGVPDQVEEIVVYYNKDLVPEVPHTVEELRQISDELKRRERSRSPLETGNSTPQVICLASGPATCWAGKGWITFSMETVGGTPPR
jgi:raffinose/stachyose/melibiose transport system substrate-binding protein